MDQLNFKMSNKQIQKFARMIFADIETYVETHKQEYEKFVLSKRNSDKR